MIDGQRDDHFGNLRCVKSEFALGVPDRQWTTSAAPAGEQFPLWQEAVDAAFVPVTVRPTEPGSFPSEVAVHRLGSIELADFAAPPQSVSRTAEQVSHAAGDVFFLNLPLTGGASVRQAGRTTKLSAADFVVVDSDQPFDLDFGAPFRQISLKLPREVLTARLVATDDVLGARVDGGHGIGAVASAAIRATAEAAVALDRQAARELGDRLADLVALAVGGVRPQPAKAPRTLLLQAARAEAERRIGDPALSPATVAAQVGISTRYLHRLFSDDGVTFRRWLQLRRLGLAHADLADAGLRGGTIGQIAHDRGFEDPSYFARAFRARYEISPTAFRAVRAARGGQTRRR